MTPASTRRQQLAPQAGQEPAPPPLDGGRPTRTRKMPSKYQDFEMGEARIRRTPSSDDEDNDVEGMMEDDNHGTDQRPEQSNIDPDNHVSGSGRTPASNETQSVRLGNVVLGLRDLLVDNGVDKDKAAMIIGRLAMDF